MKKIIISSDALKPALSKLGQVVNPKALIPVLSNLYCKVEPNKVELIGSNTEITIFYRLECESNETFEFLLPFDFLNKIANLNKHCPLEIEAGKLVKIKGPNDAYEIKVADKIADFIKLPELPKKNSLIIKDEVLQCLNTAVATTNNINPKFANVLMELAPNKVTIASTDGGYAVYSKEFDVENTENEELLLSKNIIKALEGCSDVKVFYHSKAIGFETENFTLINTRSEIKFVNFRKVFPDDWPANLTLQKDVLIEALGKCSLTNDQLHTTKINLTETDMRLVADDGVLTVNVAVPVAYSGKINDVSINSEKLLKLLNQIENDEIEFAVHDAKRAIVLSCKEDRGYKGMIMPIAVN